MLRNTVLSIMLLILLMIGLSNLFIVNEEQRVIVTRLGNIVQNAQHQPRILGPGLRWQIPFIDQPIFFDQRIQNLNIPSSAMYTEEKKELIIDLFIKWRINDFSLFFQSTNGGDQERANKLLKEKVVDGVRVEIGRRKLNEVVSQERQQVMSKIRIDVNNTASKWGMEVVDVRIVRIELPTQVNEAFFKVMRTERERIASERRAYGSARADEIRATADAQVIILKAKAEAQANQLRGQGEAEAANLYASSYGQDPEFYSFYRSLEAYRETFKNKQNVLVLKPDDAFFKYFKRNRPELQPKS